MADFQYRIVKESSLRNGSGTQSKGFTIREAVMIFASIDWAGFPSSPPHFATVSPNQLDVLNSRMSNVLAGGLPPVNSELIVAFPAVRDGAQKIADTTSPFKGLHEGFSDAMNGVNSRAVEETFKMNIRCT
jgi:hypothetical protein